MSGVIYDMLYCADSYHSPTGMEKELLRNLKFTAIHNPAKSHAIFESFVTDLNFWDIERNDSNVGGGSGGKNNKKRGRRSKIPGLTQATKLREQEENDDQEVSSKAVWKSAVDPTTGKTYYYDAVTRRTQWHKPAELKALERKKKLEKRKRDKKFFNEMEQNILKSLQRGEVIPGIPFVETKKEGPPQEPLPKSRIRTISGMDDILLAELRDDYNNYSSKRQQQQQPQAVPQQQTMQQNPQQQQQKQQNPLRNGTAAVPRPGRPPLPLTRQGSSSRAIRNNNNTIPRRNSDDDMLLSPDVEDEVKHPLHNNMQNSHSRGDLELAGEKFLDAPIHNDNEWRELENELATGSLSPPTGHTRRNTGGTIYLQNTMINPDIKATMKCVCAVYRAHIVQAHKEGKYKQHNISSVPQEYEVFNDNYGSNNNAIEIEVPSLADVVEFHDVFYRRSQMEHDTIITSLIYVERVIKSTNGALSPNPANWKSLLFACMVLSSKVFDDLSMYNIDFSNVSAHTPGLSSFTLRRINQLELELLTCLQFDVKVPASEYAKYYFLIRTMLLRSGLVKEDEKPLGKRDAFRKLETLTNTYLKNSPECITRDRRAKSMDDSISACMSEKKPGSGPVLRDSVCLEQLIG